MSKELDGEAVAFIMAQGSMASIKSYVERGRQFGKLPDAKL